MKTAIPLKKLSKRITRKVVIDKIKMIAGFEDPVATNDAGMVKPLENGHFIKLYLHSCCI